MSLYVSCAEDFAMPELLIKREMTSSQPLWLALAFMSLWMGLADSATAQVAETPKNEIREVQPADAKEHVGKTVRVRMTVTSIGGFLDGQVLNSASAWDAAGNFQVVISGAVVDEFKKRGTPDPARYFAQKRIEVTGAVKIIAPGGKQLPAIAVLSPDDIAPVLEATRKARSLSELANRRVELHLKDGHLYGDVLLTEVLIRGEPAGIFNLKARIGNAAPKLFPAAAITEIVADGVPFDLSYDKKTKSLLVDEKQREARIKQASELEQRVLKRGAKVWEFLDAEEITQRTQTDKEFLQSVQKQLPQVALRLVETKYYMLLTDLDAVTAQQYLKYLDAMYEEMCRAFGVAIGTNIWAGKCLVVAFQNKADFLTLERDILKRSTEPEKSQGLCHSQSNGQVLISIWKGDATSHFANALVHETSHGFVHRYRSNARLPSWLNEGMADWIANLIVKNETLKSRQAKSAKHIQQQRSLAGYFEKKQIAGEEYGIASSMVDILLELDTKKFRPFFVAIKEGTDPEDALRQVYQMSYKDLARLYGRRIGLPDLQP